MSATVARTTSVLLGCALLVWQFAFCAVNGSAQLHDPEPGELASGVQDETDAKAKPGEEQWQELDVRRQDFVNEVGLDWYCDQGGLKWGWPLASVKRNGNDPELTLEIGDRSKSFGIAVVLKTSLSEAGTPRIEAS